MLLRAWFLFVGINALCLSAPAGVSIGFEAGISHCALENRTGTGYHIGIDIGYHVHPNIAINITPQFKTTNYYAPLWPSTNYEFTNLYVPLVFSIIPAPGISGGPYVGIGPAVNVQLRGKGISEPFIEYYDIKELETDFYLIYVAGFDLKWAQFNVRPEFFFNQNMTANFPETLGRSASIYDFGFALSFSYAL